MGVYNTCVVNAPVDQVWSALRDLHDMSWAPRVITSLDKVGDVGPGGVEEFCNPMYGALLGSLKAHFARA